MIEIQPEQIRPGPKSKYTEERVEQILGLLKAGNTRGTSARASGISPDTFSDWMARYPEFSDAVKEAEAEAVAAHVQNVLTAAAKGSWQASAWWLERRHHPDWGKKDRIEIMASVRELALATNQDPDAAIEAAHDILKELRSAARA